MTPQEDGLDLDCRQFTKGLKMNFQFHQKEPDVFLCYKYVSQTCR